jgi:hypothetical protein
MDFVKSNSSPTVHTTLAESSHAFLTGNYQTLHTCFPKGMTSIKVLNERNEHRTIQVVNTQYEIFTSDKHVSKTIVKTAIQSINLS